MLIVKQVEPAAEEEADITRSPAEWEAAAEPARPLQRPSRAGRWGGGPEEARCCRPHVTPRPAFPVQYRDTPFSRVIKKRARVFLK